MFHINDILKEPDPVKRKNLLKMLRKQLYGGTMKHTINKLAEIDKELKKPEYQGL